jgi:hypothetical protein
MALVSEAVCVLRVAGEMRKKVSGMVIYYIRNGSRGDMAAGWGEEKIRHRVTNNGEEITSGCSFFVVKKIVREA